MKPLKVTIQEIKAIKALMTEVDKLKEDSYTQGDYTYHYNGQEASIDAKEAKVSRNIEINAKLLNVHYNVVVDMCYDFDFARRVLDEVYNNDKQAV